MSISEIIFVSFITDEKIEIMKPLFEVLPYFVHAGKQYLSMLPILCKTTFNTLLGN